MKSLHGKIVDADYRKIAKRFVVIAVLFAVVGGITGALLLRPHISDIMAAEEHQQQLSEEKTTGQLAAAEKAKTSYSTQKGDKHTAKHEMSKEKEHDGEDILKAQIRKIPEGKLAAIGVIGVLGMILAAVYWLLIAAWLYKAAVRAKMHSLVWLLAGLAGNLAAVVVFLVLRNIFREHCSQCGSWCRKGRFCTECGNEFAVTCPACGAQQPADQKYCGRCGAEIQEKSDSDPDEETDGNSMKSDETEKQQDS